MQKLIETHLEARTPGLCIITQEEMRAIACIAAASTARGYKMHVWSPLCGIREMSITADGIAEREVAPEAKAPPAMLDAFLNALPQKSVLVLPDFHLVDMRNLLLVRKLKETLWQIKGEPMKTLIILGADIKLPPELQKELWLLEFQLPTREELVPVLQGTARCIGQELNGDLDHLVDATCGLTLSEAEQAAAISAAETKLRDGKPMLEAPILRREKCQTIKKGGILEIFESKVQLDNIGGLDVLKGWVRKRRQAFGREAKAYGLPTPKGFLMVGIPGCGKSLTAKATANILGVPLLKLDGGKIFGSLVGESERNLRTAIQTAEAVAPCVLWIDELEKAFAGTKSSGQTDGGTSARVFGSFLQWLQEKTASVFVVATANDVSQLPPELLRKGRFDEMWFVDLPEADERQAIWRIQIEKQNRQSTEYDLAELARITDGFTGAEIEAVFNDALYAAFDAGEQVQEIHVATAVAATVPLSKTMATELDTLRTWAEGRARRASTPPATVRKNARKLGLEAN